MIRRASVLIMALGLLGGLWVSGEMSDAAPIECPPTAWTIYDGEDAGLGAIAQTSKRCLAAFVLRPDAETLEYHWDRGGRIQRDRSSGASLSAAFGEADTLVIANRPLGEAESLWAAPEPSTPPEGCQPARWRIYEGDAFGHERVRQASRACLDVYVLSRTAPTLEYHWDRGGALLPEQSSELALSESLGQADTFVVTDQAVGEGGALWTASAADPIPAPVPDASPPAVGNSGGGGNTGGGGGGGNTGGGGGGGNTGGGGGGGNTGNTGSGGGGQTGGNSGGDDSDQRVIGAEGTHPGFICITGHPSITPTRPGLPRGFRWD